MSYFVIESIDKAALDLYRDSQEFKDGFLQSADAVVRSGSNEHAELDDEGGVGKIYWLLIEDDRDEDNVTYRLDAHGQLQFWATGVEV